MTGEPLDARHAESLRFSLDEAGADCRAIITNSPHNTEEATAIVRNVIALAEDGRIEFAAMLFKNIWGDEKGRISFFNRPSFLGEIVCCWRARWILGSKGSPEHAYAWYVWRREPKSGLALKVRVSEAQAIAATIAAISREADMMLKALDLYSKAADALYRHEAEASRRRVILRQGGLLRAKPSHNQPRMKTLRATAGAYRA